VLLITRKHILIYTVIFIYIYYSLSYTYAYKYIRSFIGFKRETALLLDGCSSRASLNNDHKKGIRLGQHPADLGGLIRNRQEFEGV